MTKRTKYSKGQLRESLVRQGYYDGRFSPKRHSSKVKYQRPNKGQMTNDILEDYLEEVEDEDDSQDHG